MVHLVCGVAGAVKADVAAFHAFGVEELALIGFEVLFVLANAEGVIDSDYRGDIGVILYNTDKKLDFGVRKGDRIAQIIFETCYPATFSQKSILTDTARQAGGFGSTGV